MRWKLPQKSDRSELASIDVHTAMLSQCSKGPFSIDAWDDCSELSGELAGELAVGSEDELLITGILGVFGSGSVNYVYIPKISWKVVYLPGVMCIVGDVVIFSDPIRNQTIWNGHKWKTVTK